MVMRLLLFKFIAGWSVRTISIHVGVFQLDSAESRNRYSFNFVDLTSHFRKQFGNRGNFGFKVRIS